MPTYDGRRNGPVHNWFELTYSSYLVLPRLVLSSMPIEWQERFVQCLNEARERLGHHCENDNYLVRLRGANGRFISDPLSDYRRGKTLEPEP